MRNRITFLTLCGCAFLSDDETPLPPPIGATAITGNHRSLVISQEVHTYQIGGCLVKPGLVITDGTGGKVVIVTVLFTR